MKKCLLTLVSLVLFSFLSWNVWGQSKPLVAKTIVIKGEIQKPQAFYFLSRAPLNYEALKMSENFAKKVVKAIDKKPF